MTQQDAAMFPVMAWNRVPGNATMLARMRECGLTVAGFVQPAHLDLAHAAGLMAIVADTRLTNFDWRRLDVHQAREHVAAVVAEVNDHPAVCGYYLKDEPNAEEFPGLAVVADEVRRLAPGKWPYINLFPNYATPDQLGTANYPQYLEQFVVTCHPPILSYDNYALMEREDVRMSFWTNLEQMRAVSQAHGIPFWNIVLTVAHFTYREISAADARFQVFTTLAYGGRGLSYFTYFAPQTGNYRMAPIDQFGHQTPTWYYLQHVNLQISRLAPTLLQLTSDEVYHFGTVPEGSRGPSEQSLVTGASGDILAGDFTHANGTRYVMLVNKSFHDSQWVYVHYRTPPAQVSLVSPYTGREVPFDGEHCVLAPGQGSLLKLG